MLEKMIEFLKANIVMTCIIAAAIIVIVIAVIIAVCVAKKKKKAQGKLQDNGAPPQNSTVAAAKQATMVDDSAMSELLESPQNAQEDALLKEAEPKKARQEQTERLFDETEEEQAVLLSQPAPLPTKTQDSTQPRSVNTSDNNARPSVGRNGKWIVKKKSNEDFYVYLVANNGEDLLSSEAYTTAEGAKKGIQTICKNAAENRFTINCDKSGRFFYKLKTANNRILCVGEVYTTKKSCLNAVDSVKRFCETAVLVDGLQEELTEIAYKATSPIAPPKEGYEGKWVIKEINDLFLACLYASNGEMILAGESYATVDGAKKSMESIKENAKAHRFIIDKNKNGQYYYKLRTAQKNVLCVGEVYDKMASCIGAVESAIRFSASAKLV